MINYPAKPWSNGQTFIQNGVVYIYDAINNCWNFSDLSYNRISPAIHLIPPIQPSKLELEFSLNSDFSTIAKSYFSLDEVSRSRLLAFHQAEAIFCQLPDDGFVSSVDFQFIAVVPELDLSKRYFCRWKWLTRSNQIFSNSGLVYPSAGLY